MTINKELLIQRIKNSLDFTALEKRYLIAIVENTQKQVKEKEDEDDATITD